jgi:hypothetical protein
MDTLDLVVRRPLKPVRNTDVTAISSWAKALEVTVKGSGLIDKSLAIECGVDAALFSRMVSGQAGWTAEKLERFMDAAGSELPLLWLLHRRGYDVEALRQRETELQARVRQLEDQLAQERRERQVITAFVREARAA